MAAEDNEKQSSIAGKKKPQKSIIRRLVNLIILIAVLLVAAYFLINFSNFTVSDTVPVDPGASGPAQVNLTTEFETNAIGFLENPIFSQPLIFTINLKDRGRFCKITLTLGMDNQVLFNYLEARMPIVRDIINSTIQYKTAEELQDPLGVERLKAELLRKINRGVFPQTFIDVQRGDNKNPVKRILVSEFIIQ